MLVKKSTFNEVKQELEDARNTVNHLEAFLEEASNENERLQEKIKQYEEGVANAEANQTSASFFISDDMSDVKPVTRVSPNIVNKLVEAGYLSSNKTNDEFSLNLAIMLVVSEAVEQIVFSFEQDVEEEQGDYFDPYFQEDLQ